MKYLVTGTGMGTGTDMLWFYLRHIFADFFQVQTNVECNIKKWFNKQITFRIYDFNWNFAIRVKRNGLNFSIESVLLKSVIFTLFYSVLLVKCKN